MLLEGKLFISKSKRRQVEITDILTWNEAFTIFQMVTCAAHPQRWSYLTKYKLLIIQTAHQFSGRAWLDYDLAFRKDAAALGLIMSDWPKMNLICIIFTCVYQQHPHHSRCFHPNLLRISEAQVRARVICDLFTRLSVVFYPLCFKLCL